VTGEPKQQQAPARSDEFVDNVKQLLEHLYDLPFLQSHPRLVVPMDTTRCEDATLVIDDNENLRNLNTSRA
jgi:hypothetical protein